MAVMVDDEPLAAETMGLKTLGQVLSHVQRRNRLVTNLLIDGRAPDLSGLGAIRLSPLNGHTVYIETAEPRKMAIGVLNDVQQQLADAEKFKDIAIELLRKNQPGKAMEKLGGCFHVWHAAQESVLKIGQLLRLDLDAVRIDRMPLSQVLGTFAQQLSQIKTAIEHRDFVTLGDILAYEATETSELWRQALSAVREVIELRA